MNSIYIVVVEIVYFFTRISYAYLIKLETTKHHSKQ